MPCGSAWPFMPSAGAATKPVLSPSKWHVSPPPVKLAEPGPAFAGLSGTVVPLKFCTGRKRAPTTLADWISVSVHVAPVQSPVKLSNVKPLAGSAVTTYTVAQVGADTVVSMGGGGQVILVGVSMSSLTGSWIFGA